MNAGTVLFAVGLFLLVPVGSSSALAAEGGENAEQEVSLPPTLITEGATPATEVEGTFTTSKSKTERGYVFGLSSVQYSPVPSFGIKLAIPFAVRDPRDSEPTVGGIGDVSVMAKYAPLLLPARQFALSGGVTLTFPTGSERRELGGQFAVAPFLAVGKGFGPFSLQADAAYRWQLNEPRRLEPEEEGAEAVRPHKGEGVTANLTATYSPVKRLFLILELNSVTVMRGDEELKERVQLYVTPGVSVEPAEGWNLRAGVHLPVTSTKELDWSLIVIVTKGF
ncbi:MAG: transporter [Candidatus Rokubacteria bacterium]|nr:transporter [Candidatus Rokubacteria bacterium]